MTEPRFKYAALGDSSAVGIGGRAGGYPARITRMLVATGAKISTLNLGESGATSQDVLARQVSSVANKRPDLITLGIGTNDLWRMVPIERFRDNLARIGDGLESTGAPVIVSNLPDLGHAPAAGMAQAWLGVPLDLIRARVALMNDQLAALVKRPGFTIADMFSMSARELPEHPEYFSADGFHPSDEGYERWATLVWPQVEAVLERWRKRRAY